MTRLGCTNRLKMGRSSSLKNLNQEDLNKIQNKVVISQQQMKKIKEGADIETLVADRTASPGCKDKRESQVLHTVDDYLQNTIGRE